MAGQCKYSYETKNCPHNKWSIFDGTANITIADSTKLPIAGGTMTGDLTLKGNPTADLMAATKNM